MYICSDLTIERSREYKNRNSEFENVNIYIKTKSINEV